MTRAGWLLMLVAITASGEERSLRWARFDVTANLDADAVLHVEERHTIVFNGAWNGGERSFRDELEDTREIRSVARLDDAGRAIPLRYDSEIDEVDEYALKDKRYLRWRSRLPSDPPFANREITYVIRYAESFIITPEYRFDHNFGMPELEWPIDEYSLDLTFDPVWQMTPRRITRSKLRPGENVTVTLPLRYAGGGRPDAINFHAPLPIRILLVIALLGGTALFTIQFVRRERKVGRFWPLTDPSTIDRAWLEEHVFRYAPEIVGAMWDERTGSAEVAAVIARLVHEKKLSSRVERVGLLQRPNLVLTLLQDRDAFQDYEKTLVKALFIKGDTTSTDAIREHYKKRGFDPVSRIRRPLEKKIPAVSGRARATPAIRWMPTIALTAAGMALLIAGSFFGPLHLVGAIVIALVIGVLYALGAAGALDYRRRVATLVAFSLEFAIAALLVLVAAIVSMQFRFSILVMTGHTLLALAAVRSILNVAATRHAGERLVIRRRLAAAREYFARELRRPNPSLDDAWFPYLLAFGLGPRIDRWFRSFGASAAATSASASPSFASSSSTSSAATWTGGGGAFGGAGATGMWAVAASGMASGVSAPSSSGGGSGGGGGGGGGGSSGGGGGGGW